MIDPHEASPTPDRPEPIRWKRVLFEGAVIVGSILLALGAEAAWQERVERGEEQEILTALHTEFTENEVALRAQADSIAESIALVSEAVQMAPAELARLLRSEEGFPLSMAIRRPWTVEFSVGALESTMGTERASLIQSPELVSGLAQYLAVQNELGEIGRLVTTITVDAFVASHQLPERHGELIALLEAKLGYWDAYLGYLGRFIDLTAGLASQIEAEID